MGISKVGMNTGSQVSMKPEATSNFTSNPFGVSFKGNVIQADVFEKAAPNMAKRISEKGKVFASAVVGCINNFNTSLSSRMNSIGSWGQKIKNSVSSMCDRMSNVEISVDVKAFTNTLKNKLFPDSQYKVKNLVKMPVENLKSMWQETEAISA